MKTLRITLLFALALAACGEESKPPAKPAAESKGIAPAAAPVDTRTPTEKSAEAGDAKAQVALGDAYATGTGYDKSAEKAVSWYEKAAAQGEPDAMRALSRLYSGGELLDKDPVKAFEWLRRAAEKGGGPDDELMVGVMLRNGMGVEKDGEKAAEWFRKAAAHGNIEAQYYLGVMHGQGDGLPKDVALAVEWHQKAAMQGHRSSQFSLSWYYGEGEGVAKDEVLAYVWANLAAATGSDAAVKRRDALEVVLSPEQKNEAQRLSSNWKKGTLPRRLSAEAAAKLPAVEEPAPKASAKGGDKADKGRAAREDKAMSKAPGGPNLPTVKLKPPPENAPSPNDLAGPKGAR